MIDCLFDVYNVKIKLLTKMLGACPIDLNVMDRHILDRQRKLIADNSKINKAVNKYLEAKQISKEQGELELSALRIKVEELLGRDLLDEEFTSLRDGNLDEFESLRETMKELDQKGITCFLRDPEAEEGAPAIALSAHAILGFLKSSGEALSRALPAKKETMLHSSSYTSKIINQHLSIKPMLIRASKDINRKDDGTPEYLQRSLRAMTAQGPRISLAKSEVLPAGTEFDFDIYVLKDSPMEEDILKKMLSYGLMKGLGQWRNADHGQFEVIGFAKK